MGREIETLHVTKTYGGFLEGTYETCNKYLKSHIVPRKAKELFGERPLHVFWPESDPTKKWPAYTYYAYLSEPVTGPVGGWQPDDPDGWELVVVWFSELPVDEVQYDLNALLTDELWAEKRGEYQV